MNKLPVSRLSFHKAHAHVGMYMAIALVANVVFHSGVVKLVSVGL